MRSLGFFLKRSPQRIESIIPGLLKALTAITLSGQYSITVWSDAYDVILEDTLASNINPDDPTQLDNNNYKGRAINVLGITPPDLTVTQVNVPANNDAGAPLTFSYSVQNQGDLFSGQWTDTVYVADNPDLALAKEIWTLGSYTQSRTLNSGEKYTVNQTVNLAPSIKGRYLIVQTDALNNISETREDNNVTAQVANVIAHPADLQVTALQTQALNYSGELSPITYTVTNTGETVWPSTASWLDAVYISTDPTFIAARATLAGTFTHSNQAGLAAGASYSSTVNIQLPAGADGAYYVYVITDAQQPSDHPDQTAKPQVEYLDGRTNADSLYLYATSAYEGLRNDNNITSAALAITYREADLQVANISVSKPQPQSGDTVTVTWTVTNFGTRATRVSQWYDGVYLSRDDSLDESDYPLIPGTLYDNPGRVQLISLLDVDGKPRFLLPGESYTQSAIVQLPQSISGDFHLIVKTDTSTVKDWNREHVSTVRDDLDVVAGDNAGNVPEFQNEGNNIATLALPISLATPPDLQVAQVSAPTSVVAGQTLNVDYQVLNAGGATPDDQSNWNDLIYLSRDRFLDINQDRYVGYLSHTGGLAAGASYDGHFSVTAPRDLNGPYYVFVITDPARAFGSGASGQVLEFGNDQNNATTAAQPILLQTPPPADLQVSTVSVPPQANVGEPVSISYTITNASANTAYGQWTDAVYLSRDNVWGIDDILLGKVNHSGDLAGNASYSASLTALLPPLKDGSWRIIVRPDLYNEVFEGEISYGAQGLVMAPGEANNLTASAATVQTSVPVLTLASPTPVLLGADKPLLYKVSVAAGQTLRVLLDSTAAEGDNELYIRYGDIPTTYAYDAAYSDASAADQQALIASTQAGDYYILVRARSGDATPVNLRADLLPLSITRVTPDNGGVGDSDHRWVTLDIYGASFQAGALVKLSRPGVYEAEPERWQVLDATHIRAIFDTSTFPLGLYDVTVTNPDGRSVTEANRYMVERGIEDDVTIGIGGPRDLQPGDSATYTVSLQSLTNVDTPYVYFNIGAVQMGYNQYLLDGLHLPYALFGASVTGNPFGDSSSSAANNQAYGQTVATQSRSDIPWSSLDGTLDTNGFNLAPGYALDVAAHGTVGMTFRLQTYPGLNEWLNRDFIGLRDALYATHPDWKALGLLDGGVADLDKIAKGLTATFLAPDPENRISKLALLSESFQMNVVATATAMTRDEFISQQTRYSLSLRTAVLADSSAPSNLTVLAADADQWVNGWLAALQSAGLLLPASQAPVIVATPQVVSLNATLAAGILLSKGGDNYRTQADILGFFQKVQQWYGDTAQYSGDPNAAVAPIDHYEVRSDKQGNEVLVPVSKLADAADYDLHLGRTLQFENFIVFVGATSELEYLRAQGVLDEKFNPVPGKQLNLTQYLQLVAQQTSSSTPAISVQGPQGQSVASDGSVYVPAATALPFSFAFNNTSGQGVGQIRIVSQLDANLDPRSLRLGDLKIGDINIHVPADRADFQGDFDFSGSKGYILRVSAGIDTATHTATWLLQAIDPSTGEVMQDLSRALLAPGNTGGLAASGFVSFTVQASATAPTGARLSTRARILFDGAPPTDSATLNVTLDADVPTTTLVVTSLADTAAGQPSYSVKWNAQDAASGIRFVTVYVATNGGDFKIWQRQVPAGQTDAVFVGIAGNRYEFLAVATDNAGNREAASVTHAVLPDDGASQQVLAGLGVNASLSQTASVPQAATDRSYADNTVFAQAALLLPGQVASVGAGDLRTVLSPFTAHAFADGFAVGNAGIGAMAMVMLPDQSVLVSAGTLRNEVYRYSKDGGHSTTPLFSLDAPIVDMTLDALGQLWVMTGQELLQVDVNSGTVLRRISGPNEQLLTRAVAVQPGTGKLFVSTQSGIDIFDPQQSNPSLAWQHFSNTQVGDLAFGPDGRLWAIRWSGSTITAADPNGSTDILSFPMSGATLGRAELEYRLNAVINSIAFGVAGSSLDGLLIASGGLRQHVQVAGVSDTTYGSSLWMVNLATRKVLQVAGGGTQGEAVLTTADGRILLAQTHSVDELSLARAPKVLATSVPDGALMPLPLGEIAVQFDQAMWLGNDAQSALNDATSVLDADNYRLLSAETGATAIAPSSVRWDALTHTAYLNVSNLPAGQYQLTVSGELRSNQQLSIGVDTLTSFTALLNMSTQVRLNFSNTRADVSTGEVSYDVSLTNIGTDDLHGPLMLLLDPGAYFGANILGAHPGSNDQADLWVLDLSNALTTLGGKLAAGATLAKQTISVIPASVFGANGLADLAKFNLGHGVYAVPMQNVPPSFGVVVPPTLSATDVPADTGDSTDATGSNNSDAYNSHLDYNTDTFPVPAVIGQPWTADVDAMDSDGTSFFWQIVQAPAGMTLTPPASYSTDENGAYHSTATLNWTPDAKAAADTTVVLRVQDSRGGVALRTLHLPVINGNHAPVLTTQAQVNISEGQTLSLPLSAADADGDRLTYSVANLPAGASFDARAGLLNWTPTYDQAGTYDNIRVTVSDGKTQVSQQLSIVVAQTWAKPVLAPVAAQTLREGDNFALQLNGSVPGGLAQADGTRVSLDYWISTLPAGMQLNSETGWLSWTPGYTQHGDFNLPVTLTATYTLASGETLTTTTQQVLRFSVLNANGAPRFDSNLGSNWNTLEGQALSISVFAFDPENPDFAPKIRNASAADSANQGSTAATVSYQILGLPQGAVFDPQTLEIDWTPGYDQAGTYHVTVIATDDGDGTGVPASSQVIIPITVADTNRAPVIAPISNVFVDKGATLDIPVDVTDVDGNPIQFSLSGLPRFATYTANPVSANGHITGTLHLAPGDNDRGDYTITLIARDNGNGDPSRALTQALSFVVTARSVTEAPVFNVPQQIVAVAGQPFSLPIVISDADQDALHLSSSGLPIGAQFTLTNQYGQALFNWTPSADDVGTHDITFTVTDSGLPPQDSGFVNPAQPVANVTTHTIRVLVRATDTPPQLLGIQLNGSAVADSSDLTTPVILSASEGAALSLGLFARDADADLINWTATGLPQGMSLNIGTGATSASLNWTPGMFAAQSDNIGGTSPGTYRFSVTGSDGAMSFTRTFEVRVSNVDQAPVILPMPLQLVNEGSTLAVTVQSVDADGDPTHISLVYDENTPAGVSFNGNTGHFEWTPDANTVNNAIAGNRDFTFTFKTTDGTLSTLQTLNVRVFDVNRAPQLTVANHALVVGQSLSLPVQLGGTPSGLGIYANDPDGAVQTQNLAISFNGLPEGASYDAAQQRLNWTPGPGQVGDFVVTAQAFDGVSTTQMTFTLRVVADAAANAPSVLIDSVPGTPTLPGQNVLVNVRASSYSTISSLTVQVRGTALGSDQWQTVALDSSGRLRMVSTQPGLIEVKVIATDADGFSRTQISQLAVRDPADNQAPILAWSGTLSGASASGKPLVISSATTLQASLNELQLMGYRLQIAAAGSDHWQTLAEQSLAALSIDQSLDLSALDPANYGNGLYQLRLSAWDLSGRTSELDARLTIDSALKTPPLANANDVTYQLGGHDFAVNRSLNSNDTGDFGNWTLAGLNTGLTTDQLATTNTGATAAWALGAKVWLQMPASLATADAALLNLRFTLGVTSTTLAGGPGAPIVYHASFGSDQGWQLDAVGGENLQRQGTRLFDQNTGLPWVPSGYVLTAPDGTQYSLDAQGKLNQVSFVDGTQWLVSDNGVALVGGTSTERVTLERDTQNRIVRISGPLAGGTDSSIAYRYDAQNRLILARALDSTTLGSPYGYDASGAPYTDSITANLGSAANWIGNQGSNHWQGQLQAGQTTTLSLQVRDSELASTVKVPGAQGALILAIKIQSSDASSALQVVGGDVLGDTLYNGVRTLLVRVTEAGLKLLRLTGTGNVSLSVSVAGDLNQDASLDGTDSAAWTAADATGNLAADLNGDGLVDQNDRQILYANYGWRANLPPVPAATLPTLMTHTGLSTIVPLTAIAQDYEGDGMFWRVLSASHGTATLSSDGMSLVFTPEAGYSGLASVFVSADDGFGSSAPIQLNIQISSAKLTAIHVQPLGEVAPGQAITVKTTVDFEDQLGVDVSNDPSYINLTGADLSGIGQAGTSPLSLDDSRDLLRVNGSGPGVIIASHIGADGVEVRAVQAINSSLPDAGIDPSDAWQVQPDVYPNTLTLLPDATRQLKVHLVEPINGTQTTITQTVAGTDSGTRYFSSDDSIASVSDSGLITTHRAGSVTLYVVFLGSTYNQDGTIKAQRVGQATVELHVEAAQLADDDNGTAAPQLIQVLKDHGGIVSAATGESVMIGAGVLSTDSGVSIHRVSIDDLAATTALPASTVMQPIGAFTLDLSGATANYPLQLAIPVQGAIATQAGEEVYFFRKGTVMNADGSTSPTWWLVDDGYIGADGIARTASPPYSGLDSSGEYVVTKVMPGVIGSNSLLTVDSGGWAAFEGAQVAVGGGLAGVSVQSEVIGILASAATTITAGSYHFGVPQFAKISIPSVAPADGYHIDIGAALPDVVTPYGNVVAANITDASADVDQGVLNFTVDNTATGAFAGNLVLRAWFTNGSYRDVQTLPGTTTGKITVTPPADVAVGTVRWQLVRQISTDQFSASGNVISGKPLEFAGNSITIAAKTDMAAILTRTGVQFVRKHDQSLVAQVSLVDLLSTPNDLNSTYLTGNKVQDVVISDDLSRAYIGGNGMVYVIDMVTYKLISTITIPGGKNITSLVTVADLLFIGEGQSFGNGASGSQLRVMDIDPGSKTYNQAVTLQGTGIENSPLGISGMAIGADGKTLVVGVPLNPNSVSLGDPDKRGGVIVLDLATLNYRTGKINPPIIAQLPGDGISGKSPQTITATRNADQFLVTDIADYGRGLSTLVLTRDAKGAITSAVMSAIQMSQPTEDIRVDRLDIQRAQSAVLVTQNGVQYAIVSDDNYNFDDPYWRAMYEAPTFIYLPSGPPLAAGGSASAKQVAVGGKLGIIQDPFGVNGAPVYLGATLPLDGYGIVNLSVSEDGSVLLGQLKGGFGSDLGQAQQNPNQNHVWSVADLIGAALAAPEKDRLSKHIVLPSTAEQLIPAVQGSAGAPISTMFDAEPLNVVSDNNRLGDIIQVDAKTLAIYAILGLPSPLGTLSADDNTKIMKSQDKINALMDNIENFSFVGGQADKLTDTQSSNGMTLVTRDGGKRIVTSSNNSTPAENLDFLNTGLFYVAPTLTDADEIQLRLGNKITDKISTFSISFTFKEGYGQYQKGQSGSVNVTVKASDAPGVGINALFGDRDLKDPGYSAFTLSAPLVMNEAASSDAQSLDIWRVEQRLKYLAFPAMGLAKTPINTPVEFVEDGVIGEGEERALQLFSQVVNYKYVTATAETTSTVTTTNHTVAPAAPDYSYKFDFTTEIKSSTSPLKIYNSTAPDSTTVSWLNAYNAPHWMQFFSSTDSGFSKTNDKLGEGWQNVQTAKTDSVYGTSWTFDLMVAAKGTAPKGAQGKTALMLFNGAGELGMTLNLKINPVYISNTNTYGSQRKIATDETLFGLTANNGGISAIVKTTDPKIWNTDNANALVDLLNSSTSATATQNPNETAANTDQKNALQLLTNLYSLTQSSDSKNSWGNINIQSSNGDPSQQQQIRTALFGDGSQLNGLVDSQHILLGGEGISYELTDKILGEIMIRKGETVAAAQARVSAYVTPLNNAMKAYDINTPARIAAFLAQLKVESGSLIPLNAGNGFAENFNYSQAKLASSSFSATMDPAEKISLGRPAGSSVPVSHINQVKIANILYGSEGNDRGNVFSPNRTDEGQDGWVFSGKGFIQLTGRFNYTAFVNDALTKGLITQAQSNTLVQPINSTTASDTSTIATDPALAAYSAAWFWSSNSLNKASDAVELTNISKFMAKITLVINSGQMAKYQRNDAWITAQNAIFNGNAYGNMVDILNNLGITATGQKGYESQIGINLKPPTLLELSDHPLESAAPTSDVANNSDSSPSAAPSLADVQILASDSTTASDNLAIVLKSAMQTVSNIADLPSGTLGLTLENGSATTITLDSTADGNGWFIDSTAADNNEFLPTADANVFEAKAGSAAENKMDMLSVLLHEYGHALGFDHSPDANDFMGATLKLGERRLPTADELALMVKLISQAKSATSGTGIQTAAHTSLSTANTLDAATRTLHVANAEDSANGQSSATANTLAMQSTTLSETEQSQARLNQVFVVQATDSFLRFTLSNVSLQNPGDMPEDAFEASLVDATTGQSLANALALSDTHALLNLQGDGQSFLSQSSTVIVNPDGSRTYTVDLRNIPVGTAVNLSFDLIGFGPAGSQVTVSDVALMGLPQTNDDTAQGNEDSPLALDVLGNDLNAGGYQPVIVSAPTHGQLTLNADGSFSYVPQALYYGADSFSYQLSNSLVQSNVATVSLNIAHVNHAPKASDLALNLLEDGSVVIGLQGHSTDVDGDAQTLRIVSGPQHGSLTQNADGTFTYVPATLFYGSDSFTYVSNDGALDSNIATVNLVVSHVNHAPTAQAIGLETLEEQAVSGNLLNAGADVDGDVLTAKIVNGPQFGSLSLNTDGTFTYLPNDLYHGTDTFSYLLNDGVLDSAAATVTITMAPVNHAPTVSSSDLLFTLAEDGSAAFDLLAGARDVDGDTLSVRITANPQHGTLQQQVDGTFSYVPNALFFGTDSLRYVVNDGSADSTERTVSFTVTHVNHAPVTQDVNLQTLEEQAINGSLVSSASDVDGDTLSSNLVNSPQHGTVKLNADGTFVYTPAALYRGTDTFSYRSNDGALDSAVATVTITMTPVNHAPTVSSSDLLITLTEDGSTNFNLLTGANDVDGDTLAVRIVANPQHGTLQQQVDGTFSYVPNALFFGTDSLRYVVNDGSADSAERTVSFTVTHVNHAPVAQDVNLQTREEQAINGSLVPSASDVDGDALSFNLVNAPQHGTVKLNADGTFTYTPAALYRGIDTFSYRLNDGSLMSNVATVTLTMTPVNHAPKAKDAALQLAEDGQLQLDLLAYGSDPDGDALTASVVSGPTHGSLQRNTDGSYRYVPVGYFAGTDSFTYRLNDGSADSNTGTVTLTITPVNHAAQAQNDSATTDQGKAVIINVLANDSDIDNSTGANGSSPLPANTGLTVKLVSQPANGKVTLNTDGTLTYTPNATFSGTDSFSYVANDGQVDSTLAAVTITVKATNQVPVANDDQYTVKQGAALSFNPLLNDTDADGDALSIVLVSNPAHGQLTRNADGSLTYVPTANWSGTDTLTYEVSDGKSLSNVATVKLVITPSNQAPVAANDQVSLHNNQTAVINVLANDSDADGDKLTTRLVGNAKHGTVTHNADGSFSYTALCGYTGSDSFTYLDNDGKADSNLAQVNITVLGLNLPPLAFDDLAFVDENKAVSISPQANDWDINGDALTARVLCLPSHGSLSLNSDGSYTYTPTKNWYGVDAFTYQAFDGQFYSNPAMVYIKVNRVDLAPVALNDAATVQAGQSVNLNVLANDYDADGDALVATVTSSPKHGTLSRNRDGSFTYVAKAGYVGTDTFTYVANDGYLDSAAATVTLTILAPNRPPVAHDDQAATLVNTAVRINVLANDSDPDGDALSARIVCAPSHGRLSLNADGSFLYTPDSNWRGTDAFSYRASDGQALSDVAQVCISVTVPNRAPTAKNATYQLPQNGNLRIDFSSLVNDADNDNLTLTLSSPAKGTLTRNKDGSYSYQPKANFIGTDTFTYTVSDGKLSTTATVALNVLKDRNCATSLVISSGAQGSGVASQNVLYRVINQNGSFVYVPDIGATTVVDWSTQSGSNDDCGTGDDWWDVLFQPTAQVGDLGQLTGLVIKR